MMPDTFLFHVQRNALLRGGLSSCDQAEGYDRRLLSLRTFIPRAEQQAEHNEIE